MAFGSNHSDGFDSGFGGAAPMADINTTPLVDVMLVLLVIFIVTAPLMTQSIPVRVPKTATVAAPEPKTPPVRLALDAQDRLFWNETPIAQAELPARLAAAAALTPPPEVRLAADQDTRYVRLAEVMAAIKAAGIERMGFVTQGGQP